MRSGRAHWVFRVWTVFLSATFAVLLFPAIVAEHGIAWSMTYTGMGVGFIWLLYFGIGRFLGWAVTGELLRRGLDPHDRSGRLEGSAKVR